MVKKKVEADHSDETVKEKKANAKKATKSASKKAVEAVANKMLTDMAVAMPGAGAAKRFLDCIAKQDEINAKIKVLNTARRGVRGILRGDLKVNLKVLGLTLQLRDMETEDMQAFEATLALYKQQIGLMLTEEQKTTIASIDAKRAQNKKAIAGAQGGDTGEEVGSEQGESIPERNDALSAGGVAAPGVH